MQKLIFVIALFVSLCFSDVVLGQSASGSFSEGQRLLNQQAFDATNENDFKKAEGLYKSMLLLGEHNVTYLNLGRAYLKQGKCMEASETLDKVESAPQVDAIPMDQILARLEEYRGEMSSLCTARMILDCNPPGLTVSIDGGEAFVCHKNPIPATPGQHSFLMRYLFEGNSSFDSSAATKDLTEGDISTVQLSVDNSAEMIRCGGMTPEEREKRSMMFKIMGWTFVGVGVATAGSLTGYILYQKTETDKIIKEYNSKTTGISQEDKEKIEKEKKDFKNLQIYGWTFVGVGGLLAVMGATLLIFDSVRYSGECKSGSSTACDGLKKRDFEFYPMIGVQSDGANFGLGFTF